MTRMLTLPMYGTIRRCRKCGADLQTDELGVAFRNFVVLHRNPGEVLVCACGIRAAAIPDGESSYDALKRELAESGEMGVELVFVPEHMDRVCQTCGFTWPEAPRDWPTAGRGVTDAPSDRGANN